MGRLENEKKLQKQIETCGAILVPFYYEYVKWVEQNAQYPVFGAMRGANTLIYAADKLSKMGAAKTGNWKRLYINKAIIAEDYFDKTMTEYLTQEGITTDKSITLIKELSTKNFFKNDGMIKIDLEIDDEELYWQDFFYKGVNSGLEMCANSSKGNKTTQYLQTLSENKNTNCIIFAMEERNQKYIAPATLDIEKAIPACKKNVEQIYR